GRTATSTVRAAFRRSREAVRIRPENVPRGVIAFAWTLSVRRQPCSLAPVNGDPSASRDLRDTARFLYEVFPVPRFADARYLVWYYRTNPVGPAVETDLLENGAQLGHFAGIPQVLHSTSGTLNAALLVDVSVSERARGRGLMSVLHDDCVAEARARFATGAI